MKKKSKNFTSQKFELVHGSTNMKTKNQKFKNLDFVFFRFKIVLENSPLIPIFPRYGSNVGIGTEQPQTEMQLEDVRTFINNTSASVRKHFRNTFTADEDGNIQTEVMFLNIAALFSISNLPYAVIETLDILQPQLNPHPSTTSIMLVLFVCGFNVNPCIFFISNPWFSERCAQLYHDVRNRIVRSSDGYEQI